MPRHHVAISPDSRFIIVAVSGSRTIEASRGAIAEVVALRAETGIASILFDACLAFSSVDPAAQMARALKCGEALETSRVAILTTDEEEPYARIWRKGLSETGHDAIVFTDVSDAEAWLSTLQEGATVYLS